MSEQDDWGEMDEVNPQTPAAAATAVRTWWNGSGSVCGATSSPTGNAAGGEDNLNYLTSGAYESASLGCSRQGHRRCKLCFPAKASGASRGSRFRNITD